MFSARRVYAVIGSRRWKSAAAPNAAAAAACPAAESGPAVSTVKAPAAPGDGIPRARGLPLIGTALEVAAMGPGNLHKFIDDRHRQLGPIFREKLGAEELVFVADPEEMPALFKQDGKYPRHFLPRSWVLYNKLYGCSRGLFFMDGEEWWSHRKTMNKLLLRGDLSWLSEACELACEDAVDRIANSAEDLEAVLYTCSLQVIAAVLLGAESYQRVSKDLNARIDKLASVVKLIFHTTCTLEQVPSVVLLQKLQLPPWKRFVRSVDEALAEARAFLDELLRVSSGQEEGLLAKLMAEGMEESDIRKIVVDLILAGGDTTAYALEWLLYCTAKDPGLQEELRRDPGLSRNFLKESLRLYPVAAFLTRYLPEDSKICGYHVPKDSAVILSIYTSGRDPRVFRDPHVFRPSRWDRADPLYSTAMQRASLPFAAGVRSCIGRKMAEVQLTTTLQRVVQRYDLRLMNEKEVQMTLKMVAVPSEPLRLKFTRRPDAC